MANSELSKFDKLKQFLKERGIDFVYEIKSSHSSSCDFALFVSADHVGVKVDNEVTSRRQLNQLTTIIKEALGISVEWIITPGEEAEAMESTLYRIIEQRYPSTVVAVYISSPKQTPITVWIEPKPGVVEVPKLDSLKELAREFFKLLKLEEFVIQYDAETVPTTPMLIRNIKAHSPINLQTLAEILKSGSSSVPNLRWLQRKLDTLRKQGLLSRSSTGEYCLTELALHVAPHDRSRSSSDILRGLALGRRKW